MRVHGALGSGGGVLALGDGGADGAEEHDADEDLLGPAALEDGTPLGDATSPPPSSKRSSSSRTDSIAAPMSYTLPPSRLRKRAKAASRPDARMTPAVVGALADDSQQVVDGEGENLFEPGLDDATEEFGVSGLDVQL